MKTKIFACGDIVNTNSKVDFIDSELKHTIKECDLAICNLEAPVTTTDSSPIKKAGPHIHQSKESIKIIKESGFNLVSIANNHIYDYGQKALENTIIELNKNNLSFVGGGKSFEEAYSPRSIEINDIKISIVAACENEFGCLYEKKDNGGYAWLLSEKIEDTIRTLKKDNDFVILIAHAGVENVTIPLKEWRAKYRRFCDIGADIIIGHHPHVPQGYEEYNNSLIFYSLGNFYFDTPNFTDISDDSYSIIFTLEKNKKIDFEIIYHKKINNQTCLSNKQEVNFNIDTLQKYLNDDYSKKHDAMCLKLFHEYYEDYYKTAMNTLPHRAKFYDRVIYILNKVFFPQKNRLTRNLLLLHNIRIDSHRFVVQRALSLMVNE